MDKNYHSADNINEKYSIKLPDADVTLKDRCNKAAYETYGNLLPSEVKDRINLELDAIKKNGHSSKYLIAAGIADKAFEFGHFVTTRGLLGSSFIAHLCGISKVNPLPAHYICEKCKHFEFVEDMDDYRKIGHDLPEKACPECDGSMKPDGANIPPEVLMGWKYDRNPDIIINIPSGIHNEIISYLKETYGKDCLFRAGVCRKGEDGNIEEGVHPGGIYIVSKDIREITLLRNADPDDGTMLPVTRRDYSELYGSLDRYDILPFAALDFLYDIEKAAGVMQSEIRFNDPDICKCFIKYGFGFIPVLPWKTMGDREAQAIRMTKPEKLSDIAKLIGVLTGTGTWENNGELLIKDGKNLSELIAFRDDIYQVILSKGLDSASAYRIMKTVYSGKTLSDNDSQKMIDAGVSSWEIESCRKIKYLYPKSHAVEYAMMAWKLAYYKLNYPEIYIEIAERYL